MTDSPEERERKRKNREKSRRYRQRNPQKKLARKDAQVIPKRPCQECAKSKIINWKVEAHHEDHSRPWDVRWLCKKHHEARDTELDRLRKETNGKEGR